MKFIENRVSVICNELKGLIFTNRTPVEGIQYKKGLYFTPQEADSTQVSWEPFDSKSMHWYGPDEHYWFRAKVTIPEEMDGKCVYLKAATQVDHWDDAKNPQFRLTILSLHPVQLHRQRSCPSDHLRKFWRSTFQTA